MKYLPEKMALFINEMQHIKTHNNGAEEVKKDSRNSDFTIASCSYQFAITLTHMSLALRRDVWVRLWWPVVLHHVHIMNRPHTPTPKQKFM